MLKMLKKELSLTASPISYLFILFGFMAVIPQYPILVGGFFVCFGIFQTFQTAREANDIIYCAMLPVKKSDIVKSKYVFTVFIQMCAFVLFAILTALRMGLLNDKNPYAANQLMTANLAFLGYILVMYALFNYIFVNGYFKTAYKIGAPFLTYAIAAFVAVGLFEALHFMPGLEVLQYNYHYSHLIVLFAGMLIYAGVTLLSLVRSIRSFDKIDL